MESLSESHAQRIAEMEKRLAQATRDALRASQEAAASHEQELHNLHAQLQAATRAAERSRAEMSLRHEQAISMLKTEHETALLDATTAQGAQLRKLTTEKATLRDELTEVTQRLKSCEEALQAAKAKPNPPSNVGKGGRNAAPQQDEHHTPIRHAPHSRSASVDTRVHERAVERISILEQEIADQHARLVQLSTAKSSAESLLASERSANTTLTNELSSLRSAHTALSIEHDGCAARISGMRAKLDTAKQLIAAINQERKELIEARDRHREEARNYLHALTSVHTPPIQHQHTPLPRSPYFPFTPSYSTMSISPIAAPVTSPSSFHSTRSPLSTYPSLHSYRSSFSPTPTHHHDQLSLGRPPANGRSPI